MPATQRVSHETYTFTLVTSGGTEPTDEIQGGLIRAGCDDALLGSRGGVVFLDFDRQASSLAVAIGSAIRDVERAGVGLRVDRVEPDELVTTTEIARRIDRSREAVRLYASGRRGPGGFPPTVSRIKGRTPLYRWSEVAGWLKRAAVAAAVAAEDLEAAGTIGFVNAILETRRLAPSVPEASMLSRSLQPPRREATIED